MSYRDLEQAFQLAKSCKFYTTTGGKTDEEILKSEKVLGIHFSPQSIEFYKKCGYLSFYGNEIFGIDPNDASGVLEGNSIAYALNDRKEYQLPFEWIPIFNFNDGSMAYLDYSKTNSEKEPQVITAFYNGTKYQTIEKIADDLGEFILQRVNTVSNQADN